LTTINFTFINPRYTTVNELKARLDRKMISENIQQHKYTAMVAGGIATLLGLLVSHWLMLMGQSLLIVGTVLAGTPITLNAFSALKVKVISIELLVTIAVVGAMIIGEYHEGAIVTFLFLFGDWLENKSLAKTRSAIEDLATALPTTVKTLDDAGQLQDTPVATIQVGATVQLATGTTAPVDGTVVDGQALLDESRVTGESTGRTKAVGDPIYSGSTVVNGRLLIKVTQTGDDTVYGQIIDLVEEAQDAESPVASFIQRFAKWYTPLVLLIAAAVGVFTGNVRLAITILVLGCPGALVIGAPVTNVVGIGTGARQGVLLKGGNVAAALTKIDTVVFDKTGTLTAGQTTVQSAHWFVSKHEQAQWLGLIADVEKQSNHPLGEALITFAKSHRAPVPATSATDLAVIPGQGLTANTAQGQVAIGNEQLLNAQGASTDHATHQLITALTHQGDSLVFIIHHQQLIALFTIADPLRPHARAALQQLRQQGVHQLIMLSGDTPAAAQKIGQQAGLDVARGGLLPADKAAVIKELQTAGHHVAFVGDGINDSPSLAQADVGIAMGSGTDVAMDTADVILMNNQLPTLNQLFTLAVKMTRNVQENIGIAVGTVALLLLGLLIGVVTMGSGMLVHEASILFVIGNALRLRRIFSKKKQNLTTVNFSTAQLADNNHEDH
jgi:Cd2+/Zn2+-exporting ATPase